MKHIEFIPVVLSVALLVLAGCSQKNMITSPQDPQIMNMPVAQIDAGGKQIQQSAISEYPINPNKGMENGSLLVQNDDKYIYVTYKMSSGWLLDAANLTLGENIKSIPLAKDGTPNIGKFDYIKGFKGGVNNFTFTIPLNQYGFKPGQQIVLATFADMHMPFIGAQNQLYGEPTRVEGWAGIIPGPGPAKWYYINYTVKPAGVNLTPQTSILLETANNNMSQ